MVAETIVGARPAENFQFVRVGWPEQFVQHIERHLIIFRIFVFVVFVHSLLDEYFQERREKYFFL